MCAQALGFPAENKFAPHITLARLRDQRNKDAVQNFLKNTAVFPHAFPVANFFLFRSELSPRGPVHTKLRTYP